MCRRNFHKSAKLVLIEGALFVLFADDLTTSINRTILTVIAVFVIVTVGD
jgi:hypothetical protein